MLLIYKEVNKLLAVDNQRETELCIGVLGELKAWTVNIRSEEMSYPQRIQRESNQECG